MPTGYVPLLPRPNFKPNLPSSQSCLSLYSDWLWPAIWMMPKDSAYGPWPISGEIDLAESRGNAASYQYRARDYISSAIHWGPLATLNRYWTTMGWLSKRRDYYNEGYNTYGLEWTDKYLMTCECRRSCFDDVGDELDSTVAP